MAKTTQNQKNNANNQAKNTNNQNYDPKDSEPRLQKFWEQSNTYQFNEEDKTKPVFSIDTPPPTVSGKMHMGHACSYSQQDFIARFKRMTGHNVFYPFGTDDNGLATEKLVQKHKKVNLRKLPRPEAIKTCIEFLDEERPKFIQDWKNIGMSCDFKAFYSTIDDYSRKIAQKSFLDLYKKGLIYRKKGPITWDRVFQTAIAQAELEDKKQMGWLNYIKAKLKDKENTYLIYATTRPEMLYACVGMSVEAKGKYVKLKVTTKDKDGKDKSEFWITGKETYEEKFKEIDYKLIKEIKGKDLIKKTATIPFSNIEVKISDDEAVKADFGTGIAYFCTYGGIEDIEWAARHNQEPIELIQKDGRLSELGKKYAGELAQDARKTIIKDLEAEKHLIKKEKKEQIVNVGERSKTEVEIIVSEQWYVKYLDRKEEFLKASEKLNWNPEFMKHRLDNWIKGLNWDWGFSRQRHFGTPIPVWYDEKGNIILPTEDELPVDPTTTKPKKYNKENKKTKLSPETDVFDTWFTSASTPYLATNLIKDKDQRKRVFPMSLRPQAHDIINFWLFYTMAKTRLLEQKNPWKDTTISGFVLDPKGRKMSKSIGNVVAPQDIIEKYSSDAIRYWAATSNLGSDLPYQEKDVKTGQKFVNKLWNAAKFSFMHLEDYKAEDLRVTETFDHWILAKLQKAINESTAHFNNYEYSKAKSATEIFFWQQFCDLYLEIVKDRLYNPDKRGKEQRQSAQSALHQSLLAVTKMMAPITPYITEEVYQQFFKEKESSKQTGKQKSETNATSSIHTTSWPNGKITNIDLDCEEIGDQAVEIIQAIRKYKSENKLSLKEEINTLILIKEDDKSFQDKIKQVEDDLKAVLHVKNIKFEGKTSIETPIYKIKIGIEQ